MINPDLSPEEKSGLEVTDHEFLFHESQTSNLQLVVIGMGFALAMLDGFDIAAMSYTAHSISVDLELTADRLGLVFSAALAGMMCGAMFVAPLSDSIGRRRMIIICTLVIGVSMCITTLANSLPILMILRFITGLGVGGMLASLAAICSEYAPTRYRSLAVLFFTTGYPVGATLGGFVAAPLIPAYGWESVFLAGGAATLVMSAAAFFYLPESIQFLLQSRNPDALERVNRILEKVNQSAISKLPDRTNSRHDPGNKILGLLSPERRRRTLLLWGAFLFSFISLYFMMSWIPTLVVTAGLSEITGVYAGVAFNGGAVAGILTLGWLASRLHLTRLIGSFLSGAACMMVIFVYADGIKFLNLNLFVIGFLLQGGFGGLYAAAAKLYPTELRATGVGWAIGLGRFGAVIGPYIGGLLINAGIGMEANFIIFALPLIISGMIAFILSVR